MTEDNLMAVDTAEALRLAIDNEKNSLEEVRTELFGSSKDVISSYKRYSRARGKVGEKRSPRNLARLSRAETELGAHIDAYNVARGRVQDALGAVVSAHDKYLEALSLSDDVATAKRSARSMDSYVRKIERFIEKTDDSVACISSHYTLRIRAAEDGEDDGELSPNSTNVAQKSVPNASFVHTNEVAVSPVSIDIGPTVERAVERAIAELSDTLEKRISETLRAVELPTPESTDTAALAGARDRLVTVSASLGELLENLDKIISDTEKMAEKCRAVVEMQRSAAREMQGIEVKQRLVNQEQAELVEAEEVVLQHQKLITERHAEIAEAQKLSADAVKQITEAQRAIDSSLKESLKSQKALLSSNSKYSERLNKKIEENESVNAEEATNG